MKLKPAKPIIKPIINDPDALLDQARVARLLGVTTKFLEARRVRGGGPCFCKIGSLVRYKFADVQAWIDERRWTSTSEASR